VVVAKEKLEERQGAPELGQPDVMERFFETNEATLTLFKARHLVYFDTRGFVQTESKHRRFLPRAIASVGPLPTNHIKAECSAQDEGSVDRFQRLVEWMERSPDFSLKLQFVAPGVSSMNALYDSAFYQALTAILSVVHIAIFSRGLYLCNEHYLVRHLVPLGLPFLVTLIETASLGFLLVFLLETGNRREGQTCFGKNTQWGFSSYF
jgi:hypothetical protein